MIKGKISIIVPAYNAEKYLQQAIDSVLQQSYNDWELLLINDGSTDTTADICEEAVKQDNRIFYFYKDNGGLSDARNYGIDKITGDFIYFLDADDMLHPLALEILLNNIYKYDAEISCGGNLKFYNKDLPIGETDIKNFDKVFTAEEAIEEALYQTGNIDHSAWGKLYRKELFNQSRFRKGTWYEDLDLFYRLWPGCKRIVINKSQMYYYRQHSESYLHIFNIRRTDVLEVVKNMEEWIEVNNPSLLKAARDRAMSANFNILILIYKNGNKFPQIRERCWKEIRRLRKGALLNKKVRLKNKIGVMLSYIFM